MMRNSNGSPERQKLVERELREIIRLQRVIQLELGKLNTLSSPGGVLATTLTAGMNSSEVLADKTGSAMNQLVLSTFRQLQSRLLTEEALATISDMIEQ